jgi:hypothetical protein
MATVMIAAIRAKSGHNTAERKPLTSLLTVSRNLTKVLNERCSAEAGTSGHPAAVRQSWSGRMI